MPQQNLIAYELQLPPGTYRVGFELEDMKGPIGMGSDRLGGHYALEKTPFIRKVNWHKAQQLDFNLVVDDQARIGRAIARRPRRNKPPVVLDTKAKLHKKTIFSKKKEDVFVKFPGGYVGIETERSRHQIVGHGPRKARLTYQATGLPPGMTINPATCLIHGRHVAGSAGTYTSKVAISDGAMTDSKEFTWQVLPAGSRVPSVRILINNTADTADDITLHDEPIPATIVGTPGTMVTLSIVGPAKLSRTQVILDKHGKASVVITPTGFSKKADDVELIAWMTVQLPARRGSKDRQLRK